MKKLTIIPGLAVLLAGAALAASPKLEKADTDGDGSVSLAEFENAALQRAREMFGRLDQDADGVLSGNELEHDRGDRKRHSRHQRHDPAKAIERLDADDSGGVSLAEFADAPFTPDAKRFDAADGDGNGELDAAELRELMRDRFAERRRSTDSDN